MPEITECPCGHQQTDDGWCEVLIGREVHEIPRYGLPVCRLCGRSLRELEAGSSPSPKNSPPGVRR